jgi:rhamnosyltransferase
MYTRTFNYPEISRIKTKDDIEKMGIKAFFCSNVCAAYKREVFVQLGGFETPIIFNEDMVYAAKVLHNGRKIAYAADAVVRHSHNYSALSQLKRNFDLGVSQSCYPEIFEHISSEKEGIRLVLETADKLIRAKKPMKIVKLGVHSISKYVGYRLGRNYEKIPKRCIAMLTTNPAYWMKEE